MVNHRPLSAALGVMLASSCIGLAGCAGGGALGLGMFSGGAGDATIISTAESTRLDASFRTAVYTFVDENTADLFFTDLSSEQLDAIIAGEDRSEVAPDGAQILHVHLFLTPRAGRTPIEFSASNVTLSHYVLAGDAIGIYGGGGFLLPSRVFTREPGADRFGGQMREATVRFLTATPGFNDRIGSGVLNGTLNARLDPEMSERFSRLLSAFSRAAGRI